jgi:hypothetical protein
MHFDLEFEVSRNYKKYLMKRVPPVTPFMLQVATLNKDIEDLNPEVVRFGDLWKIIWSCRRGGFLTGNMMYLSLTKFIIAPISKTDNREFPKMKKLGPS